LEDLAAITAALGLVGAVTAFVAIATLVRVRFPARTPVVGARRGAAIGALVVVVVPVAYVAFQGFGRTDFLYGLFAAVSWSAIAGGLPFAVVGAVLGRWMDRRLFRSRGA
jgi:protein-S-isoprenylcysteine O-methyltransferase Ste14